MIPPYPSNRSTADINRLFSTSARNWQRPKSVVFASFTKIGIRGQILIKIPKYKISQKSDQKESRSSTHPYELFANNFGHAPKQYRKGEGRESPEMCTNFWSGNLNERELDVQQAACDLNSTGSQSAWRRQWNWQFHERWSFRLCEWLRDGFRL